MARVIHFDILAPDPLRAKSFYEAAFGWKVEKWDGPMEYWLITTGKDPEPGIDGGLAQGKPSFTNGDLTLGVESVDEAVARVEASGGRVVSPKGPVPGVGHFAVIEGPDGNQFGLMQDDPSAGT